MDNETFQALRQEDWGEIGQKLLAVAINYSQKYPSIGYNQCDDIVQDVIEKTLRGEPTQDPESGEQLKWRTWKPDKGDLLPWLKWCVKSEIHTSANRKAATNEFLLIDQDDEGDFEETLGSQNIVVSTSENLTNPETALLQQEKEIHAKQKIIEIYEIVLGDEALEELVLAMDCLTDESKTAKRPSRSELAEYLDISIDEINNRVKRLRRLLLKRGGD